MKVREFFKVYDELTDSIPEKFCKIAEIAKDCVYFNGSKLIKYCSKYYDVINYNDKDLDFTIGECPDGEISINWYIGNDEYCNVYVTENFFDDFDEFLKELKEYVKRNNEIETEKYNKALNKREQKRKGKESKEYQEYLRLKEKFEGS